MLYLLSLLLCPLSMQMHAQVVSPTMVPQLLLDAYLCRTATCAVASSTSVRSWLAGNPAPTRMVSRVQCRLHYLRMLVCVSLHLLYLLPLPGCTSVLGPSWKSSASGSSSDTSTAPRTSGVSSTQHHSHQRHVMQASMFSREPLQFKST
jgi:hypothetical protein